MSFTSLLSTVVLVSFLVTIIMAVGSYAAYKLRENRGPVIEPLATEGESLFFERITAADLGPVKGRTVDD
jgi:hypothetical protein